MYSLRSAPILAFDLARIPAGDRLAELLLIALRLDEAGLDKLAAQFDRDLDRAAAWLDIASAAGKGQRAARMLADTDTSSAARPRTPEDADAAVDLLESDVVAAVQSRRMFLASMLEQAPMGDLDELLTCLRTEILGWTADGAAVHAGEFGRTAKALAVLCDAAAALYLRSSLPPETVASLLGPWDRAKRSLGSAYRREPQLPRGSGQLLRRVRQATPDHIRQLGRVGQRWHSEEPTWAEAMQEAGLAISITERTRDVAAAQLLLVLAVRKVGWPVSALAGGDWNLLSGAAYALAARDVLAARVSHRLVAPYLEVFGALSARERRS